MEPSVLNLFQKFLIFYPSLFMILLTFAVMMYMFHVRVNFMKAGKASLGKFRTRASTSAATTDIASSSDNFMNLFEVPVLFYFLTILIYLTNLADHLYLGLMSLYVACRYIHSFVQCTYNNVNHRFYAYAASTLTLLIVFLRVFWQITFN